MSYSMGPVSLAGKIFICPLKPSQHQNPTWQIPLRQQKSHCLRQIQFRPQRREDWGRTRRTLPLKTRKTTGTTCPMGTLLNTETASASIAAGGTIASKYSKVNNSIYLIKGFFNVTKCLSLVHDDLIKHVNGVQSPLLRNSIRRTLTSQPMD